MRIKKYTGRNLKEAKLKVMTELGEDAAILSSRTLKDPDTPGGRIVEIVAAIDDKQVQKAKVSSEFDDNPELVNLKERLMNRFTDNSKVLDELASIKETLNKIDGTVRLQRLDRLSPILKDLYNLLKDSEIPEDYAFRIAEKLSKSSHRKKFMTALDAAAKMLTSNIGIFPPVNKGKESKIIAFVGPTGAGKTLTLTKLAVICKLILDSSVLIISADNIKVGGNEQLHTLASIAEIPYKYVYSPLELKNAVDSSPDIDFVFVDTGGINPNDPEAMAEIKDFVHAAGTNIVYLVQSCTTNKRTFDNVLEKFSVTEPTALILTKTDEAFGIGALCESLIKTTLPIAYITDGQEIPENIEPAKPENIEELLIPMSEKAKTSFLRLKKGRK